MDTTHGTRRVRSIAILAAIVAMLASAAPAKAERRRRRRSAVFGWPRTTSTWARTSSRCSGSRGPSWRRRPPRRGRTCRPPTSGRAKAIATLIAEEHPHLVGLQEVSLWQTAPLTDPAALTTRYDSSSFSTSWRRGDPVRGGRGERALLRVPPGLRHGRRPVDPANAVIARTDLEDETFAVTNARQGTFAATLPLPIGGQTISFPRGWATVDVQFRGKWTRFATTHLEAFSVVLRKFQAQELVDPRDVAVRRRACGRSQLAPRLRGRLGRS